MAMARLKLESTALLVVDMQEKLLPHIHEAPVVTDQVARLLDGANALELPVLVTEQYRKGLGLTVEPIASRLGNAVCVVEKLKFSACVDEVRNILSQRQLRSVIVCGIEAHVCVLQTCLDLADMGYVPFLAVDAIGSRRPGDRDAAIQRLIQAGIVPTTVESALLELVHEAGTPRFKAVLPVIK
mgnify:CR=1 FL=1